MALTVPLDPEAWERLGKQIREHREAAGYSRRALAERAGVSEKSIQVAEEGRVPRGRMPQSLNRIEQALGWLPGSYVLILQGRTRVPSIREEAGVGVEAELRSEPSLVVPKELASTPRLADAREIELTQSGNVAQDTFMRQMKRYRKMQGISVEELAKRVSALGADLDLEGIKRLESGTRLLKMSEASVLATALETDVQWLLGSGFQSGMPDELTAPPTDEELQAEAKAVERRIFDMGSQLNSATHQYVHSRQREVQAREEAEMAMAYLHQVKAQQAELERQYHYLVGRIDSLRAAKGEEQVMQVRPVYEEED